MKIKSLTNGIFKQNPVVVMVLGVCPTLAVTTSAMNAVCMGIATTFVLVFSNMFISLFRNFIPEKTRIPSFILIIATFVTIAELLIHAYLPVLYHSLGIYLSLIVVNCIVLGRAESFAKKNGVGSSILDGFGMGIGFTLALLVIGSTREILGRGSIFDYKLIGSGASAITIFILPPAAFFVYGYLVALVNKLRSDNKI